MKDETTELTVPEGFNSDETIVLTRQEGLDSVEAIAIVKFSFSSVTAAKNPKLALTKAITNWVSETKEGAKAWEESVEDMNIADLANYLEKDPEAEINKYLKSEGIGSLEIEIIGCSNTLSNWVFDSLLVDRRKLQPKQEELD